MKLRKLLKGLSRLPKIFPYVMLWSRAVNDRDHGRLTEALAKLDRLDEMLPDRVEHPLLRAYCYLGLQDFVAGSEALKNIDAAIAKSRKPEPDKKYLQLYAKYLRHELLNKGRERDALYPIFEEAAAYEPHVRKVTVSTFPQRWI